MNATIAAPEQHSARFPNGMEIELDLGVTRPTGNLTFTSTESDAVFLLLGHLPGITRENIEVSVNESEGQICVSGEGDKSSLETVVGGRLWLKNEFEIGSFRKVFHIPNDVLLDQIEVGFDEDEGVLVIIVPKSNKGEVLGRAIEEVEEKEDERIAEPEADVEAPEQEEEKESERSPTRKEDELIMETEFEDAKSPDEEEVKEEIEERLKPNGAESSRSEDVSGGREPKDVEAKTEIPQEKVQVAGTGIHQPEEETKINQDEVEEEETEINQEIEAGETKIDEEGKEKTEDEIQQEGEQEKEKDKERYGATEIQKDEKEEESRTQPDVPEKPSIQMKPSDQEEQSAPQPIGTAEDEEPTRGESDGQQQPEKGGETPRSIAFEQPREEQQTDQSRGEEGEDRADQAEQKQSDGGIQPRMDEATKEGSSSEDGEEEEKGKGPRKEENRRRRKARAGGGITPPMLVASAFLVSVLGLVFRLLRNRRRRT